jgi:hypothetical protein
VTQTGDGLGVERERVLGDGSAADDRATRNTVG